MVTSPIQLNSPPEIARLLAERVRAERLRRRWKQKTLAERSGVSLPTVRRYERTGGTSVENLLKISHALGALDGFAELLKPPPATSIAELAHRNVQLPKRGVR